MAHRDFMQRALELAQIAAQLGEVPVGAVVVKDGRIIGEGYNRRETDGCATAHAEIVAIEAACKTLGHWRLENCTLYVTLEPCAMCAGAIMNSRVKMVVFSCEDYKAGAFGGMCDFCRLPFNHHPEIIIGVMEEEARSLLQNFFRNLRNKAAD
ncbi:MAG: tRNA adenosine(34) deaminase TadA [Oscillospiraceae bacterium]|nr:tRNA adenosine(34) deaminase TadA [Oscillospiraceae bacterium]